MKFLIYLFAFYLLILPATGIAGNMQCQEPDRTDAIATTATDHCNDHKENCNPFCNCACCFHITANHIQLQRHLSPVVAHFQKIYAAYKNLLIPSDILKNIWQPPKIVA